MFNISMEVQEIMSEVQNSKEAVQSVVLLVDEASKSFSALFDVFLVSVIMTKKNIYNMNEVAEQLFNMCLDSEAAIFVFPNNLSIILSRYINALINVSLIFKV